MKNNLLYQIEREIKVGRGIQKFRDNEVFESLISAFEKRESIKNNKIVYKKRLYLPKCSVIRLYFISNEV